MSKTKLKISCQTQFNHTFAEKKITLRIEPQKSSVNSGKRTYIILISESRILLKDNMLFSKKIKILSSKEVPLLEWVFPRMVQIKGENTQYF